MKELFFRLLKRIYPPKYGRPVQPHDDYQEVILSYHAANFERIRNMVDLPREQVWNQAFEFLASAVIHQIKGGEIIFRSADGREEIKDPLNCQIPDDENPKGTA